MYAKIDVQSGYGSVLQQQCVPLQITHEQGSIDETQNKIAIYRFSVPTSQFQTASGEVDNNALGQWFMGGIGLGGGFRDQIGNGWTSNTYDGTSLFNFTGYFTNNGSDSPLAILDYSQVCQGNVCTIVDNVDVPQDSYVVYVAKILGNYIGPIYDTNDENYNYLTLQNKFLSKNILGNGVLAKLPEIWSNNYSMGDTYFGPLKTESIDSADCESGIATSTPSVPQINITPSQLDFTATKGSNSSNQGSFQAHFYHYLLEGMFADLHRYL